jgi:hypothetical protein
VKLWSIFKIPILLVSLIIVIYLVQLIASERVEVVELHTLNNEGEEIITRLWVVDDEGYQYLRVGADGSGWFDRLRAAEMVDITRNGRRYSYSWTTRQSKSAQINLLMRGKYGWGDSFIGYLTGGRDGSIPVELRLAQ